MNFTVTTKEDCLNIALTINRGNDPGISQYTKEEKYKLYLAKEYLKEKKILDEEEVKKIGKGLEELNKGAIIATNSSLFIKIMLKVAVFNLLALIF